MSRVLKALLLMIATQYLVSCAVPNRGGATSEEVARAAYQHDGPASLTLYTMLSNKSGSGAHTSIMINGSQRVAFDPAGSFRHPQIVSRNDTVYGMTPYLVDQYTRFHARETFHVVIQEIIVSPEVAEKALQLAINHRAVQQSYCAKSTAAMLQQLPGFEDTPQSFYPRKLMDYFSEKGASFARLYEYDDDDKSKVLAEFVPEYER